MNLGKMISNLRKKNSLSQEELSEKVGVTRQTISKWELEETAPDINQAKMLSKIFNVSLDELTNNDVNNILVEKVTNTEKLAGITIKILKAIGIFLILIVVIGITGLIVLNFNSESINDRKVFGKYTLTCNIDNEEYAYEIEYNKDHQVLYGGGDSYFSEHADIDVYDDANKAIAHVSDWFKDHNGSCIIKEK